MVAASSSFDGTATSTVTSRSPVLPLRRARPARAPGRCARWWCPAGILSDTVESSVGTVTVLPSTSSG